MMFYLLLIFLNNLNLYLMISLREISEIAPNRAAFHDLLVRNGFYLPAKKSSATTLVWMYAVF